MEEAMVESMERDTETALNQVGLQSHAHKTLAQLSSGWRYKCRLVATLIASADMLIVDEPSFLDARSMEWLVDRLIAKSKTDNAIVLLISHKESLLEALCDRILHIHSANRTLTTYHCGYQAFRLVLETDIQQSQKTLRETQDQAQDASNSLKHVQSTMKKREANLRTTLNRNGADQRFIKGKNKEAKQKADKSAASKLKRAKEQVVAHTKEYEQKAKRERVKPLTIEGLPASERTILSLEQVGFKYNNNDDDHDDWVFQNLDMSLEGTDRVLVKGANGCGKTTLVKLILGKLEPTDGSVHRERANHVLYFPQMALHDLLRTHGQRTAVEFLSATTNKNLSDTEARQHLGALGLTKTLALQRVHSLSAGQRVRLWLARELLLNPKPTLLILDEITENVDVETRKSLVEMLNSFAGAALVVSHDPDFCESCSFTKTWEIFRHGMKVSFVE